MAVREYYYGYESVFAALKHNYELMIRRNRWRSDIKRNEDGSPNIEAFAAHTRMEAVEIYRLTQSHRREGGIPFEDCMTLYESLLEVVKLEMKYELIDKEALAKMGAKMLIPLRQKL